MATFLFNFAQAFEKGVEIPTGFPPVVVRVLVGMSPLPFLTYPLPPPCFFPPPRLVQSFATLRRSLSSPPAEGWSHPSLPERRLHPSATPDRRRLFFNLADDPLFVLIFTHLIGRQSRSAR